MASSTLVLTRDSAPAQDDPRLGLPPTLTVPLLVHVPVPTTSAQPVAIGVPFPRGGIRARDLFTLRSPGGAAAAVQTRPLAHWPDGSVKWLLAEWLLGPQQAGTFSWSLEVRQGPARAEGPAPRSPVEPGAALRVDAGPVVFEVDATGVPLLRPRLAGQEVLDAQAAQLVLTDERGRQRLARAGRTVVEEEGPLHATLRLEGVFAGRPRLRFLARLCFFAGTGLVRLRLTVHNPRRARHEGGLWDLGDPGSVLFKDLSLELTTRAEPQGRISWQAEPGQPWQTASERLTIYQDSSGGPNWNSRNHVNRHGQVPCTFRGYRVEGGGETTGLRASPVLALPSGPGLLGIAVPEFWQQFPKALEVQGRAVRVGLFPGRFADLFELQGGEQKTHTVWLSFEPAQQPEEGLLAWAHAPARVALGPQWFAASGAIPFLVPSEPGTDDQLGQVLARAFEGERSFFSRREVIDEYGWRHYGDVYADHEAEHYKGPPPVISHYNNQYDVVFGSLVQFCRTGDPRWRDLLDPLARHVMDIDIYHTKEDRAAYNGGLFWHTDHYKDAATATHRTYSRANCKPGDRSYGGGPSDEHIYAAGLLHYYYLSGDLLARDAVLELAEYVIRMDDGRLTVFGLLDDGPTGLASTTAHPDYHGPGRGGGNSINVLLDGWTLTSARRYLAKAEELIRRCIHPEDDVAARDLLNVESRWSYTVFLSALARYLDVKLEAGENDFGYAYAQASLLAYARWMLDNESPYLDHPERLDFPTEAWAAQEFRKANVLRLAARHAAEPVRSRLLQRGNELGERAWKDLLTFPSFDSARALAILMVEGVRDAFFRRAPLGQLPAAGGAHDFGRPQEFVPQKARVLRHLPRGRGALRALSRLASPGAWWTWLFPSGSEA